MSRRDALEFVADGALMAAAASALATTAAIVTLIGCFAFSLVVKDA